MEQYIKEKLLKKKGNSHYINRYLKLISVLEYKTYDDNTYCEKHHILPKSIWKKYENDPLNILRVSGKAHYILHWILAKAYGGKQWYSFNQMRRIGSNSILYHYARIYISEIISKTNSGKIRTEEERSRVSKFMKGKTVVYDPVSNSNILISVNDSRYISGELTHYRVGYKHSEETIQKIKQNNGVVNKKCFVDENGKLIYLNEEEGKCRNLYMGNPYAAKTTSERLKGGIWVHIILTGKDRLIRPEEFDDNLHIKGRKNGNGWSYVNSSGINKGENSPMKNPETVKKVIESGKKTRAKNPEKYAEISRNNLKKVQRKGKIWVTYKETGKQTKIFPKEFNELIYIKGRKWTLKH